MWSPGHKWTPGLSAKPRGLLETPVQGPGAGAEVGAARVLGKLGLQGLRERCMSAELQRRWGRGRRAASHGSPGESAPVCPLLLS